MLGLEHLNPPITTRGVEVKCFDYTSSGMIRTQVIDTRVLLGSKGTEYRGTVSTDIRVCTNPLLESRIRQHYVDKFINSLQANMLISKQLHTSTQGVQV